MENKSLRLKKSTAEDISQLFISYEHAPYTIIELQIRIEDSNINVREFGAFLSIIDGVFGRISKTDYLRYSLVENYQIRISEIRKGSIEIIIAEAISQSINAAPYVVLLLFIRYLGIGIKGLSEVSKNLADSYKSVQEGRLAKVNRELILSDMDRDETLRNLSKSQRRQLIKLLGDLEHAERRRLAAARRFVRKSLLDVNISTRDK